MKTGRRTVAERFGRLVGTCRWKAPLLHEVVGRTLPLTLVFGVMVMTSAVADVYHLHRRTTDGGGGMRSIGGDFELSGTIGQPDASLMSGNEIELAGGFWFPLEPGDCNADGTVGLIDVGAFLACMSGPAEAHPPDCACYDLDRDGDVDLYDAARIERTFNDG